MTELRHCILVVDDDDDILSIVSMILESHGYTVLTAEEGAQALAILRANPAVDLILLDMMMPGVNGWQFRDEQRRDSTIADIPVVVLTGDGRAEDRAAEIGAVDWLQKPVDLDALFEVITRHLGSISP